MPYDGSVGLMRYQMYLTLDLQQQLVVPIDPW